MRVLVSRPIVDLEVTIVPIDAPNARQFGHERLALDVVVREDCCLDSGRAILESSQPIGDGPHPGKQQPGKRRASPQVVISEKIR
jgi:hypothetical protein